ncbi:MAG: type II toxin-antitoxin system VapC family toxin [Candidatus Dormibacteraceae bacterium]
MPTRGRSTGVCLLDTSAAVTFVRPDQDGHAETYSTLVHRRKGLAGHAVFETYSVLTRLPPPQRVAPRDARRLIEQNFPDSCHLDLRRSMELLTELAYAGIAGGAVYDALVAACAREHGLPLVTRDRRAVDTYRTMGAEIELLE